MPDALRNEIAAALRTQHLLVNPVVDVSVIEYRSRDVTIAGAVKAPTTIQEIGNLRLLNALSQAGGLLPEAGPEIIVEQANGSIQRLSVRQLFDGEHPELNVLIFAGAQIRVPQCERVFVVGNVKRPGAFPFQNLQDTTVLQLLALSGGLDSFSLNKAYIYREQLGSAAKNRNRSSAATHSGSKDSGCEACRQRHPLHSDQWETESQRECVEPCYGHGQHCRIGCHLGALTRPPTMLADAVLQRHK